MNSTQEEAVSTLLEWAKEDENSRGLLIIADDEENIRKTYHGRGSNLVESLVVAMRDDKELYTLFATAMLIYKANKEDENDKE